MHISNWFHALVPLALIRAEPIGLSRCHRTPGCLKKIVEIIMYILYVHLQFKSCVLRFFTVFYRINYYLV